MTLNDVVVPIEILTYSDDEGTVNGHTVTRGRYATIHDACIALTVPYAQQAGAPILTHAVDTIGIPSEYWLHVHPDGQATPAAGGYPSSVPRPRDPAADTPHARPDSPELAPLPVLAPLPAVAPFPPMPPLPTTPDDVDDVFPAPPVEPADETAEVTPVAAPVAETAQTAETAVKTPVPGRDEVDDDPHGLAVTQTFERIPAEDAAVAELPAVTEVTAVTEVAGAAEVPAVAEVAEVAGVAAEQAVVPDDESPRTAPPPSTRAARRHAAEANDSDPDVVPTQVAPPAFPSPEFPSPEYTAAETSLPLITHQNLPAAVVPAPISPAPINSAPITPTPITPTPVTQAPVTPAPITPPATPAFLPPRPPAAGAPAPLPVSAPSPVSAPAPVAPTTGRPQWVAFVEPGADPSSPTLDDLLATRPAPPDGPAQLGWRATVRRLTGGLITLRPNHFEVTQRKAVAAVQRSLTGPKTVVVINPKGGASKTTATLLLAATFGRHRGGYTLAWDNNETRGTMGWRAMPGRHTNTAVDLLRELGRFDDARSARVGDLDNFVRNQGNAQFDVLASDEDAASGASVDATSFNALHLSLSRFYRVIVVDTGNNMRASNWDAALAAADQVVIVSTIREDTGQSAAWVADALNEKGYADKVSAAVTILAAPSPRPDAALATRLEDHFGRLTRGVVRVPFDASLVSGGPIDMDALSSSSRDAWLEATALVAEGL